MLQRERKSKIRASSALTAGQTDRGLRRGGPLFSFLSFSVTSQSRNWSGTLCGSLPPRGELSQSRYGNERAAGKEGLSLCLVSARGQPFTSILSLHQKMFRVSSTAVSDIRRTHRDEEDTPTPATRGTFYLDNGGTFPAGKTEEPSPYDDSINVGKLAKHVIRHSLVIHSPTMLSCTG